MNAVFRFLLRLIGLSPQQQSNPMPPAVPTITSVSSPRYVASGPQQFTITGTNFNKNAKISVGTLSNVHPTSATWTVIVPAPTTLAIRIKNPNGATSATFQVAFTLRPAPDAPSFLILTLVDQSIRLNWTGVPNVDRYVIERSVVSGGEKIIFYTNATQTQTCTFLDGPLSPNVTYYYDVRAQNATGTSDPSNEATLGALPPPNPPPPPSPPPIPNPPTNVFATSGENGQSRITWTNSVGATSYTLFRGLSSSGPFSTNLGTRSSGYINTGLTNGTTYYYVVVANNVSGSSGNSNVASATPQAPAPPPTTPPAVPTGLTATAGDAQVQLSCNAVSSNNGQITYHFKRGTVSGGPYTTFANPVVPNTLDTGRTNGVTYYYVVSAQNLDGTSANSAQVSATPQAINPPPPPPPPPSGTTITVLAGGDVQAALDAANAGDTVSIHPAVFASAPNQRFILRAKTSQNTNTDADYITVQSSDITSLPPQGTRIDPTVHGSHMPTLVGNAYGTLLADVGAHHWKIIGINFTTDGMAYTPDIVSIGGTGSQNGYPTRAEVLALNHISIERCFIHPAEISASSLTTPSFYRTSGRGIHLVGCDLTVRDCWIGGFAGYFPGTTTNIDSLGLYADIGFGPMLIKNNYIQANYNNILLGGADSPSPNTATVSNPTATSCTLSQSANLSIGDVIAFFCDGSVWKSAKITGKSGNQITYTSYGPSGLGTTIPSSPGFAQWNGDICHDFTIEDNTFVKLAQWNAPQAQGGQGLGAQWKAFVEVKHCHVLTMQGNTYDGQNAYPGAGITLSVRNQNGSMPWSTIDQVNLLNETIKIGCGTYIAQQVEDNEKSSLAVSNWLIQDCLFEPLGPLAYQTYNYGFSSFGGNGYANPKPNTITYNHNTILNQGVGSLISGNVAVNTTVFNNNILFCGTYDWNCAIGTKATCWPGWSGTNNLVIDVNGISPVYPGSIIVGSIAAVQFINYAAGGNFGLYTTSPGYHAGSDGANIGAPLPSIDPPPAPGGPIPVVPGAFGFGMSTRAAYGGSIAPQILRVTNLNDSGSGSLRDALVQPFPRVVIFETSGTIALSSDINIDNPYITIAAQTAPSPGITIRNFGLALQTHDILIRHLRVRPGDGPPLIGNGEDHDACIIYGAYRPTYNIVIANCSISWAQGKNSLLGYVAENGGINYWRNIISEGLYRAQNVTFNQGDPSSFGLLMQQSYNNVNANVSMLQNLFAHNSDRNPEIHGPISVHVINNVIYDWGKDGVLSGTNVYPWATFLTNEASLVDVIGNQYIAGIRDANYYQPLSAVGTWNVADGTQLYMSDNAVDQARQPVSLFTNQSGNDPNVGAPPVSLDGLTVLASSGIESWVLARAGARPLDRDSVDTRIVNETTTRTGTVIRSQSTVGGWPNLAVNHRALTPPANPNVVQPSGYTALEEWLNAYATALEP